MNYRNLRNLKTRRRDSPSSFRLSSPRGGFVPQCPKIPLCGGANFFVFSASVVSFFWWLFYAFVISGVGVGGI